LPFFRCPCGAGPGRGASGRSSASGSDGDGSKRKKGHRHSGKRRRMSQAGSVSTSGRTRREGTLSFKYIAESFALAGKSSQGFVFFFLRPSIRSPQGHGEEGITPAVTRHRREDKRLWPRDKDRGKSRGQERAKSQGSAGHPPAVPSDSSRSSAAVCSVAIQSASFSWCTARYSNWCVFKFFAFELQFF